MNPAPSHSSRLRRVAGTLVAVGFTLLVAHGSAFAGKDPKKDAKEYARRGNVAYNLGNYSEAAENYEQAYRLVQDPNLLFNTAQAYRQADNPDKALAAYKGFLRTAPANHKNRRDAGEHIAEIEAQQAKAARVSVTPVTSPGTVVARPPRADEFNPFGAPVHDYGTRGALDKPAKASTGAAADEGVLRALSPTVGGDATLANQLGITGGQRAAFDVFARAVHKGRGYELGYFRKSLFAPDPGYQTSALYFRFTSAPSLESGSSWYAQAGALGERGDMHAGGGLSWKFLSVGGRVESVGDPDLCGIGGTGNVIYLVPELMVTLPIFTRLQARALGSLRQAATAKACGFHPSMSTLDAMGDFTLGDRTIITAGVGFYQFFNDRMAAPGPWPGDHRSTAGHGHIGLRYAWAEHIGVVARYRRIVYSEGVNEITVGLEVGLGAR